MKRRIFLALLLTATAAFADAAAKWAKELAAFDAADAASVKKGAVLFTGSSTIRLWKTLATDFPEHAVLNRGFGGSQMGDSLELFGRLVVPYEPRAIVIFAGTNDISSGKSPEDVAAAFDAWAVKVRGKFPSVPVGFIEITTSPSRWGQREKVIAANKLVRPLCAKHGMTFIEVREKLFGPDGQPREDLFVADRLHLNAEGYKILAAAVRPFLPKP